MNFYKLINPIKNYAWGSKTAIQTLFGIENPNQDPQAEIWMGTHSNGCSKININDQTILLSELINANKVGVLSKSTAEQFGDLPYLFKVLAAGNALSIQVHPSKEEAELGFAREDALAVACTAPNRNYRDQNHKPELVYALTPYQAMNGFRSFDEVITLFSQMLKYADMPAVKRLIDLFKNDISPQGLEAFFTGILLLDEDDKLDSIQSLLKYAAQHQKPDVEDDINALILELAQSYPDDIGLFAPMMLNVITLKPNEAMYLDARTPHAYIKGTGLEIMANSDNVLRAGLTKKYIDVAELVCCTLFEEKSKNSLICTPVVERNKKSYITPVPDFKFDCFTQADREMVEVKSAEIIFAIDSEATISHVSGECLIIKKGESVFIPAYARAYSLSSNGRVARAYN